MAQPVIALTGATGFLGARLAPALAARGWRVRALTRRPGENSLIDGPAPDWILGDLEDQGALERLASGAAVVIHAAGLIKARSRAEFFAINAAGAARLAEVTPERMILISSLAARSPDLSDYAASKSAGESAAGGVLGRRLTIIRPPAIYGPGDRATLGLFQLAARSPLLPVPAAPAARLALAFVDDVVGEICAAAALAINAAIDAAPSGGGTFAVGGARPSGYAWTEIMGAAALAVGRDPTLVALPTSLITAAGAVCGFAGRVSGRPMIFTGGKAREILYPDWSVGASELGPWVASMASTALGAGFARTVAWYRSKAWL